MRKANNAIVPADQIVFRGQETLEDTMRKYDQSITKMNDFVHSECNEQIEHMKRAQAALEKKIESVTRCDEMKAMEKNAQKNSDAMNTQMRRMHREFQRLEDDIYEDTTLDTETRDLKFHTLQQAALSQYGKLSEKYPAAMRAQMLSNIRLIH
jgi:cell fate (sporulation/competence/biofilm development) regulator YmcA (YheA/YmcA/DUF963 family)